MDYGCGMHTTEATLSTTNVGNDPRFCIECRTGMLHRSGRSCDERCEARSDAVARALAGKSFFPWQRDLVRREDDYKGCAVLSFPVAGAGRGLVYVGPSGAWTHDIKRAGIIGLM